MARFIVFEGPDGVGKSTHARSLAERLGAVHSREPGGTALGERLRGLLLDAAGVDVTPRAEALLMAAARAQHVADVVRPALEGGRHVVLDRYLYSSIAYQGHGRGLRPEEVRELSVWATEGLEPDLVILLESPAAGRSLGGDRFEDADAGFHERVRAGFAGLASADPDRWARLTVAAAVEDTERAIDRVVHERLGLGSGPT